MKKVLITILILLVIAAAALVILSTEKNIAARREAAALKEAGVEAPARGAKLNVPEIPEEPEQKEPEPENAPETETEPETEIEPEPEPETEPEPEPEPVEQPPYLSECLEKAGLDFDSLGCTQLILAAADGADGKVYCYELLETGEWSLCEGMSEIPAKFGKNGVTNDKSEGDGCTPAGIYPLGFAFGILESPETALEYRAVTADSYWVDDPASKDYNRWVEGKDSSDFTSAEHLIDHDPSYNYSVVVEYNYDEPVSGAGSAIFLHCGEFSYTAGCVAVPQRTLRTIIGWLKPDSAKILITNTEL